jgi:RNA polymerase sigma-70 factor, ECF subfamily
MLIALERIKKAQTGDAGSFNEIVLAYRSRVMGTIARMIGRPEEAEDVAQEVFTRLFFTLEKLREPELFEAWLHRITVNAAYDYLRGRGCHGRREARASDVPESQWLKADATAGRRIDREELNRQRVRNLVEELLSPLSEADRLILVLKEVEGLSIQELERIYRISQTALKVRLFRARQRVLKGFRSRPIPKSAQMLPING